MPPVLGFANILGDVGGLVARSGVFAKLIILTLFVLSVISWAVMTERGRRMSRARKGNRAFWERFDRARSGKLGMTDLTAWARLQPGVPLAHLFVHFSDEFWPLYQQRRDGAVDERLLLGLLRRGIDREASVQLERLEHGLGWLATLSAVAPFLGLLGTVWGIMHSFLELGRQGSATLDVVGPGIAEALITTVAGLAVAIPSVVGYNYFMRRAQNQEAEMQRLASVLADVVVETELDRTNTPALH